MQAEVELQWTVPIAAEIVLHVFSTCHHLCQGQKCNSRSPASMCALLLSNTVSVE